MDEKNVPYNFINLGFEPTDLYLYPTASKLHNNLSKVSL